MKKPASGNRRAHELAERDERDTEFAAAVVGLPRRASGPITDEEWDELFALRQKGVNQRPDFSGAD
jgi:hypothetical protein